MYVMNMYIRFERAIFIYLVYKFFKSLFLGVRALLQETKQYPNEELFSQKESVLEYTCSE